MTMKLDGRWSGREPDRNFLPRIRSNLRQTELESKMWAGMVPMHCHTKKCSNNLNVTQTYKYTEVPVSVLVPLPGPLFTIHADSLSVLIHLSVLLKGRIS